MMARKGSKKKKSNYSNATRVANRIRNITKHLKTHPNDLVSQKALQTTK